MKHSIGARPLLYPTPVIVVCTYDGVGKPNAMTAAWGGICCSKPPCIAISLRKATYSYHNIFERKAFTINIPSEHQRLVADYFGIASGKNVNKFATTHQTPVKSSIVDAPFIDEFPIAIECTMIHSIEIGLHTQFIGEILDIKAAPSVLDNNNKVSIEKLRPLLYAMDSQEYYGVGTLLGKAFSTKESQFKKEAKAHANAATR